jgi:hypothetical protein
MTLQADSGFFSEDGEDHDYDLVLGWDPLDTVLLLDGLPLAKEVLANTADKPAVSFSSGLDRITLSFDKK